jgi:branched-chain amino acid transport system permease protein
MIDTTLIVQLLISSIVLGTSYLFIAMSLNLILGIAHIPDFAQGGIYALAAYLLFMQTKTLGIQYELAMVTSVIAVSLVGFAYYHLIYKRLLDRDLVDLFIAAFGIFVVIEGLVALYWGSEPQSIPIPYTGSESIGNVFIQHSNILVILALVVIGPLLYWTIFRTRIGRNIRAVEQNRTKARLLGIDIKGTYGIAFVMASAISGLGGVLIAPTSVIQPTIGLEIILKGFIVAILGGLGSLPGAAIGSYLLAGIETFGILLFSGDIANMLGFILLFVILIVRPQGLLGDD